MSKLIYCFKDIIKSILAGMIVSLVLIIISGLGSILINGMDMKILLNTIKRILFIAGALGLILFSGFVLKRDARRPLVYEKQWKEEFKVIKFQNVIMFISIVILCFGIVLDRIIYYL